VKSELLEPGMGYVRISQFSETTGDDLEAALKDLRKRNGAPLKGLVLDLRNNPGGVLEAAVSVSDAFLDSGVIVTAKGRTPESKFEMDATPGDALNGAPIVILVNGGSASAAEIVAGALKDNHRAKLMGRTTFGKGSVQTVIPLSGDRAVKLTTSLYYTPSGISINHRGIAPDIELERDPKPPGSAVPADAPLVQRDPEVKRAVQELKVPTIGGSGSVSASARCLPPRFTFRSRAQHPIHRNSVSGARRPGAGLVAGAGNPAMAGARAAGGLHRRHRLVPSAPLLSAPHPDAAAHRVLVHGAVRHRCAVVHRQELQSAAESLPAAHHPERIDARAAGDSAASGGDRHLPRAAGGRDPGPRRVVAHLRQPGGGPAGAVSAGRLSDDDAVGGYHRGRERIENLAQTDALTGLLNLRMFNEVWQREHTAAERDRGVYAMLMIDMDKLKDINDTYGHDAGNSAIVLVAQCLQRSIRATDFAARFGSDEFAVLLPGATPEIAEAVVKRVRHNVFKTTLDLRSRMIRCSVSIGVVNYPKDSRDMRELLSIGDRKMYRDKELRRAPGSEASA
jgi:diguanylate cyclase (GGDEF)-like protein